MLKLFFHTSARLRSIAAAACLGLAAIATPLCLGMAMVLIMAVPAMAQEVAIAGELLTMIEAHVPAWMWATILALVAVARVLAKQIPDDATGLLGTLRRICSIISVNVPNRETSGSGKSSG